MDTPQDKKTPSVASPPGNDTKEDSYSAQQAEASISTPKNCPFGHVQDPEKADANVKGNKKGKGKPRCQICAAQHMQEEKKRVVKNSNTLLARFDGYGG